MKYGDFCFELESHFAAIQKLINGLKTTYAEDDIDANAFEMAKDGAILDCITFEHGLKDRFGEFLGD